MTTLDKVKVIVVGDAGVGKTSLVHYLCYGRPCVSPESTIGCSVEVKLHEYKAGTPSERLYFVELWDVGGARSHTSGRTTFYGGIDGILLVHDLTNRKSHTNLRRWLVEILSTGRGCSDRSIAREYDPEMFAGCQTPMLVVGTKADALLASSQAGSPRTSSVADECNAEEIQVECGIHTAHLAAAGSSNAVKITRFFDKVIERKLTGVGRDTIMATALGNSTSSSQGYYGGVSAVVDRKRNYSPVLLGGMGKSQHND